MLIGHVHRYYGLPEFLDINFVHLSLSLCSSPQVLINILSSVVQQQNQQSSNVSVQPFRGLREDEVFHSF
jgi:hypothetical protein